MKEAQATYSLGLFPSITLSLNLRLHMCRQVFIVGYGSLKRHAKSESNSSKMFTILKCPPVWVCYSGKNTTKSDTFQGHFE
jgi:hypothetical protein